jgi:hypothetical protein
MPHNSQGGVGHAKAEKTELPENRPQSKRKAAVAPSSESRSQRKGQHAFTNPVRFQTQKPIRTGSHANSAILIAL